MTLVLDHVSVREEQRLLLNDISLSLAPGDFIAMVGPNGAGKSTLLRAAMGIVRPSAGSITLGGSPVNTLNGRTRAARVSWLPQRAAFHEPMEVLDFVASARFRFNETNRAARDTATRFLQQAGVEAFSSRDLSTLSGGEQQRVALAGLLAQEAPLLLLDEPAAHLDPRQQLEIHSMLVSLWRAGRGVLCATHDLNLLTHAVEPGEAGRVRVVGLKSGQAIFNCPYDAPDLPTKLGDLFDLEMHAVVEDGRRHFIGRARRGAA